MSAIQQAIADVKAGNYVDLDLPSAYEVICKTQSLGADWDIFLHNAPSAVLHTEFNPCISLADLCDYVIRELKITNHEVTNHEGEEPLDRIRGIFNSAAIYLQRYDIKVDGSKGRIFIWRTPTERDFDRARAVTLFTLELFQQAARGDSYVANTSVSEVTMTIRGMEKFFDINIKSGINSEAWVGFDFR